MRSLKRFYRDNKTAVLVVLGVFVLWKLRGLFSVFGTVADTAADSVAGATAGVRSSAQDATDKVKLKTVAPDVTPAQLQIFRDDARAIAAALGRLPGIYTNSVWADEAAAMAVCKRYSKYLYRVEKGKPKKIMLKSRKPATRARSLQLVVLYPFYDEITGGRSLLSDLDGAFNKGTLSTYQSFYQTFIRP